VLFAFYVPGAIIASTGTFCIFCVVIMYIRSLQRIVRAIFPQQPPSPTTSQATAFHLVSFPVLRVLYDKLTKAAGPIVLFNVAFLIIWVTLLYSPFEFILAGDLTVKLSYDTWVTCMFEQLKQTTDASDSSWQSICGDTPYSSFQGSSDSVQKLHDYMIFVLSGQSIIITLIFLPAKILRCCRGDPRFQQDIRRERVWQARLQSMSLLHKKKSTPKISPEQPHRGLPLNDLAEKDEGGDVGADGVDIGGNNAVNVLNERQMVVNGDGIGHIRVEQAGKKTSQELGNVPVRQCPPALQRAPSTTSPFIIIPVESVVA
jgi:hypothetical protein